MARHRKPNDSRRAMGGDVGRLWRTGLWVLTMLVLGAICASLVLLLEALFR